MAQTQIRGGQVLDHTIQRVDLDTTTVGNAVIAKAVQGGGISLSSTGVDSGTGDVTIAANVLSVFGRTGAIVAAAGDYTPAQVGAEPALGNPASNGQVLSSTTGGARSWTSLPVVSVFGRTGAVIAAANDYTFAMLASTPTTLSGYGITDAEKSLGNPSVNGYILSSTSAGTRSWIAPPASVTPAALTINSDVNITLSLSGTPASALLQAVSITAGFSGTLSVSRGGTGAATTSQNFFFGYTGLGTGAPSFQQVAFGSLAGSFTLAQGPTTTASVLLGRGSTGTGTPQEITLGSGLSMSGTTLSVTAGGGNVSNSGSPLASQLAIWAGATTIKGSANLQWDDLNLQGIFNVGLSGFLRIQSSSLPDGYITNPAGSFNINANAIYSGGWKYVTANTACGMQIQGGSTAVITMNTAPLGSAGGAITWTEQLRLTHGSGIALMGAAVPASGNLNVPTGYMIGGTSIFPLTTARGGVPAGGSAGQGLYKNTATAYDVVWDSMAQAQSATLATTAGTVSTAGVMAGFCSGVPSFFVPAVTGRVLLTICGCASASVAGSGVVIASPRYGTGTAPAHGAAPTGTAASSGQPSMVSGTAGQLVGFSVTAVITGLTVGTAYWFDAVYGSNNASSTAKIQGGGISVIEF